MPMASEYDSRGKNEHHFDKGPCVWGPLHNGFPSYPKQKKRLANWHELYNEVNHLEDILNNSVMSYIVLISNQHTDELNFYAIHRREIQTSHNRKRTSILCDLFLFQHNFIIHLFVF